jgi:hypothetical protein
MIVNIPFLLIAIKQAVMAPLAAVTTPLLKAATLRRRLADGGNGSWFDGLPSGKR